MEQQQRRRRECERYLGLQGKEEEVEAVALQRLEMSCGVQKWGKSARLLVPADSKPHPNEWQMKKGVG